MLTGNGTSAITASAVTQYDVLVGGASNAVSSVGPGTSGQILQSAGNASNPAYSTSTYPTTNAINTLLYASSANVMSALATANNGVLTTGTSGIPAITALSSDGQIIIGSGSGAPTAATLTAGSGITITNAANSITIAASGGGGAGPVQFFTKTGIVGTSSGATKLFTTPAGGSFYLSSPMFFILTAGSGITVDPIVSVGTNSASYNNLVVTLHLSNSGGLSTVNTFIMEDVTSNFDGSAIPVIATGTDVFINVTTPATATTYTLTVVVSGIVF